MDIGLLFRKRHALADEGLPWLRGDERGSWCARRNLTGEAGVSAILIRAVQAAAQHHAIGEVRFATKDGRPLTIVSSTSRSTGKTIESYLQAGTPWAAYLPNGNEDRVTYYLGLLVLAEAMAAPSAYVDLLEAYEELIAATKGGVILEMHKDLLCRVADEVYYAARYQDLPVDSVHDRLSDLQIHDLAAFSTAGLSGGVTPYAPPVFYDAPQLRAYRSDAGLSSATPAARSRKALHRSTVRSAPTPNGLGRFVGRQAQLIHDGLRRGKTVLLAGPTGTGKTLAVEEVAQQMSEARLVRIEGKEGMLDVDFLGNIVPREDQRVWQDGPLAEAIQSAQCDPAILFLDEISRFPREQINLLIGFLNRKSGDLCRQENLDLEGDGPFYVARVPQDNSKVFACPCEHLLIVAAANFGKDYAVYPLDPALRRRFTMVVEFDYPGKDAEIDLLARSTSLDRALAEALVAVAIESRRVHENGDLPGQIDTASLIEWGRKCTEFEAHTAAQVMDMAALTWADLVCGRTHDGRVNQGHFAALRDHLEALGKLPKGGAP
ncbi:Denitrification regulatory protein NirQ [Thermoflexales bacterium]|nr:Denitrification regulatory protein NirQ [Thermoflexales bacterium]